MSSPPLTEGDTFLQEEEGHYAFNDQQSDSTQQEQNFNPSQDDSIQDRIDESVDNDMQALDEPVREQDPNEHLQATGEEPEEQKAPIDVSVDDDMQALDEPVREQDPNEHLQATRQETEEQKGPDSEHGAMADEQEMGEEEENWKNARYLYGPGEM